MRVKFESGLCRTKIQRSEIITLSLKQFSFPKIFLVLKCSSPRFCSHEAKDFAKIFQVPFNFLMNNYSHFIFIIYFYSISFFSFLFKDVKYNYKAILLSARPCTTLSWLKAAFFVLK